MRSFVRSRGPGLALLAATVVGVVASRGRGETEVASRHVAGHLEIEVVDEAGHRVDARLRLIATRPALRSGLGTGDATILAEDGRARVDAPAGLYRLVATRGPEHERVETRLELRAGETRAVSLVVARALRPGRYRAFDFHVHTEASEDGAISLARRLVSLRAEDLAGAAITDHNRVVGAATAARGEPILLPGVEVTSWAPEVGHFNVFPTDETFEHRGLVPDDFFSEVHRRPRRLVQVNHPRLLEHIAYFEHAGLSLHGRTRPGFGFDFDLLEVWNGYDVGRPEALVSVFREWLDLVSRGHRIVATGNSDSHDVHRTPVGLPRTYVEVGDDRDVDSVARALGEGRAFVTTGPLLDTSIAGVRPGGHARIGEDGTIRVHVRILAAPHVSVDHVELYLDGRRAVSVRIPPEDGVVRLDRTFVLDAGGARTLVATTRGDSPMDDLAPGRTVLPMAFTNPIHLVRGSFSIGQAHASRR